MTTILNRKANELHHNKNDEELERQWRSFFIMRIHSKIQIKGQMIKSCIIMSVDIEQRPPRHYFSDIWTTREKKCQLDCAIYDSRVNRLSFIIDKFIMKWKFDVACFFFAPLYPSIISRCGRRV